MSVVAAIRNMLAAGLTIDQALIAAETFEASLLSAEEEKKAAKREANREKVSSWRAKQKPSKNNDRVTNVTNVTVTTVTEILSECLSETTARDLVAHRKAKKSPLTAGAAKALVKSFRAYGDPEGAAQAMMARGWTGFKAEWMREETKSMPSANGKGGFASLLAKSMGLKNGRQGEGVNEALHVLPLDNGAERGNGRHDGGELFGDIIDVQPAGSSRSL